MAPQHINDSLFETVHTRQETQESRHSKSPKDSADSLLRTQTVVAGSPPTRPAPVYPLRRDSLRLVGVVRLAVGPEAHVTRHSLPAEARA
jgi:hypothetical protein